MIPNESKTFQLSEDTKPKSFPQNLQKQKFSIQLNEKIEF